MKVSLALLTHPLHAEVLLGMLARDMPNMPLGLPLTLWPLHNSSHNVEPTGLQEHRRHVSQYRCLKA